MKRGQQQAVLSFVAATVVLALCGACSSGGGPVIGAESPSPPSPSATKALTAEELIAGACQTMYADTVDDCVAAARDPGARS